MAVDRRHRSQQRRPPLSIISTRREVHLLKLTSLCLFFPVEPTGSGKYSPVSSVTRSRPKQKVAFSNGQLGCFQLTFLTTRISVCMAFQKLLAVFVLCLFSWSSAGPLRSEEEASRPRRQGGAAPAPGAPGAAPGAAPAIDPSSTQHPLPDAHRAELDALIQQIMIDLNTPDANLEAKIRDFEGNGTQVAHGVLDGIGQHVGNAGQSQYADYSKDPTEWNNGLWVHEHSGVPTPATRTIRSADKVPRVDRPRRHPRPRDDSFFIGGIDFPLPIGENGAGVRFPLSGAVEQGTSPYVYAHGNAYNPVTPFDNDVLKDGKWVDTINDERYQNLVPRNLIPNPYPQKRRSPAKIDKEKFIKNFFRNSI